MSSSSIGAVASAPQTRMNAAHARASAGRRVATRIGVVAASILAALLTLEIAARALGLAVPRRAAARPLALTATAGPDARGMRFVLVPSARGAVVYPGVRRDQDRVVEYAINEHGFRGPSMDLARTPGVPRIAVLGDSFTYGTAISYEETFPARMRELFAQSGRDVEVLNLGVFSYNARQSTSALVHWEPRVRPDIALLVLYINDASGGGVVRAGAEEDAADRRLARIRALGLTSGVWAREDEKTPAQARMMWVRERSVLVDRAAHVLYRTLLGDVTRRNYRLDWAEGSVGREMVRQSLAVAARFAAHRGVELHVAMYPDLLSLGPPYAFATEHAIAASLCEEAGLPFHDLTPLFVGQDPPTLVAHAHDHHPNPRANRIVAEHLVELFTPAVDARTGQPPLASR